MRGFPRKRWQQRNVMQEYPRKRWKRRNLRVEGRSSYFLSLISIHRKGCVANVSYYLRWRQSCYDGTQHQLLSMLVETLTSANFHWNPSSPISHFFRRVVCDFWYLPGTSRLWSIFRFIYFCCVRYVCIWGSCRECKVSNKMVWGGWDSWSIYPKINLHFEGLVTFPKIVF